MIMRETTSDFQQRIIQMPNIDGHTKIIDRTSEQDTESKRTQLEQTANY